MTTLQKIKDNLDWRYTRECRRRNEPEYVIDNGEFKIFYDTVCEEIYRMLGIEDSTQSIALTPVTVFTEYALSSDYGGYRGHEYIYTGSNSIRSNLEIVPMGAMPTIGELVSGFPNRMAIYSKDSLYYVYLYPLVSVAGTLKMRYKKAFAINDGGGAGAVLTGTSTVPVMYQSLLIDGLMAQLFPDMQQIYYAKLNDAIYDRPIPNQGEIEYNLGGLNDEDIDNGFSKNFNGEV